VFFRKVPMKSVFAQKSSVLLRAFTVLVAGAVVSATALPVSSAEAAGPAVEVAREATSVAGEAVEIVSAAIGDATDAVVRTKPANFWECILDRLPGSSYSYLTKQIIQGCRFEFPYQGPIEKKETYFFGLLENDSAAECVTKHLAKRDTPNRMAQRAIQLACLSLYPIEKGN
jgi:hypothetical protein